LATSGIAGAPAPIGDEIAADHGGQRLVTALALEVGEHVVDRRVLAQAERVEGVPERRLETKGGATAANAHVADLADRAAVGFRLQPLQRSCQCMPGGWRGGNGLRRSDALRTC